MPCSVSAEKVVIVFEQQAPAAVVALAEASRHCPLHCDGDACNSRTVLLVGTVHDNCRFDNYCSLPGDSYPASYNCDDQSDLDSHAVVYSCPAATDMNPYNVLKEPDCLGPDAVNHEGPVGDSGQTWGKWR